MHELDSYTSKSTIFYFSLILVFCCEQRFVQHSEAHSSRSLKVRMILEFGTNKSKIPMGFWKVSGQISFHELVWMMSVLFSAKNSKIWWVWRFFQHNYSFSSKKWLVHWFWTKFEIFSLKIFIFKFFVQI